MSRIPKWKIEKTKIKVVFRLQFHATHIPQSGWDKLYISFIPADSGKATAKTTKANVRNGTCKWADPIYETTRLLQDIKTKQFDEKLYKFVVAMGSSRSSLLGEATINLADYADASKPYVVPLPLIGCDSGAMLHVTVQLLTSKTGFREFEQQRELRERGLQVGPDQNGPDQSSSGKVSVSEDILNSHMVKVNQRVRFKEKSKEHPLLEEDVGLNEDYGDSAVGFDGSSNTSESLYLEKHDTSSTHEIDSLKSTVSGDLTGLSHSPRKDKGDPLDHRFLAQGTNNWVHGWSSDYSGDNDLTFAYEENGRLRGCLEVAESSTEELKMEVSLLQNHATQISAETEKFSQQLVTEISSGERLEKEVSALKLECSKLKDDLEQMTSSKLSPSLTSKEDIKKGQDHLLQDLEAILSKGLLVMEDKIRELQNKACLNYHETDYRFLQSYLEALLGILQDLKQGTQKEMFILRSVTSERCNMKITREMSLTNSCIPATSFDAEFYQPEPGMVPCISVPGLMSHEPDSTVNAMEGRIFELLRELDESKAERESLAKKMDQMECYYEALVQELEENQRQMLGELQSLRNEHSTCLFRVQTAKAEMEAMHQDMNEKVLRFAEEKQDLESLSKELERRAIIAEAALKRARLNYSIAVGQLQKDLELLSSQVMSVFETNENLIRQAFVDSSQTNSRGYSDKVQNHGLDSEEFQPTKPLHSQNQYVGVKKQQLGGEILLEDLKRSLNLQETLYQKVEEEVREMHYQNVYLDVFSNTILETLLEASDGIKTREEKIDELAWKLELSLESKEILMQRLQTAMDDVHSLNEYKATCIAKYNELALQKQALEANVENITHENHLLSEKITELECCLLEYKSYKSKFDACVMEKTELASLLKEGTVENDDLRNNNSSLQEELRMIKTEFDELVLVKEKLQITMDFLRNRFLSLMSSFGNFFDEPSFSTDLVCQDIEFEDLTSVIVQLEEVQNKAYEKFRHLLKEKNDLMGERDKAQVSLFVVESDMMLMKQKFERDVRSMVSEMDLSNVAVEKLQLEIEAVAEKLKVSSEVEETYALHQRDLLSDLEHFETELQQLTFKNREIAEEILVLESVNEELGSNKLTVAELVEENKVLVQSLRDKSEEASKLALELNGLKESLHSVHDELQAERSTKDKLESVITDLTSQMNENHHQLLQFDQQKSELGHLKHMLSELESEKSRVCSLLQQSKECLSNAHKESSTITSLESQLSEMHELSIAADASFIFLRAQYETWTTDLVHQLSRSERQLAELQKKHLNFESILNGCLAREAHCIEENRRLSASLDSLKSELEASMAENKVLINKNNSVLAELQDYKSRIEKIEVAYSEDNHQHALEVERLKHLLCCSREEIDNMMVLKEELELNALVLKAKLDEQGTQMNLLEGRNDEVLLLQNQCNELSQRLSEQILKTEEFKNLSIHLKELKDKADAESVQAREKRELELEASMAENKVLINKNSSVLAELQDYKSRIEKIEIAYSEDNHQHALEVERLKYLLGCSREEIDNMMVLKEELEFNVLVLKAKLGEQGTKMNLLEGRNDEMLLLQNQCNELSQRLSEQILKTEEFKNLSIHLKELKDKADAEFIQAREKRESELKASMAENKVLLNKNSSVLAELQGYKSRIEKIEVAYSEDNHQHALEVERLNYLLGCSREEIDNMTVLKEELEFNFLVLKAKLDEQGTQMNLLEGRNDEVLFLQNQCNELSQRLSEQILKTEEFKNLSIHLKELKDKTDVESIQAREKRESEAPPTAVQESLRIAFIKEQYETRLHELKHQLAISKMHSEEMLWKLQDAVDDIESRKKSEASHLKRNEELGVKILELEAELQALILDKREKMRAYDLMKAELDCSMISLEWCKEEKQKLEAYLLECNEEKQKLEASLQVCNEEKQKLEVSLQECNEEKTRISFELSIVKELLETSNSTLSFQKGRNGKLKDACIPDELVINNTPTRDIDLKHLDQYTSENSKEADGLVPVGEGDRTNAPTDLQPEQHLVSNDTNEVQSPALVNQCNLPKSDAKHLALINDRFKPQSLRSSMDHLNSELERMKNENLVLSKHAHHFNTKFPGLQQELMQLDKVNEELGSIFPLFNEYSETGNALERVLALELELAEALQTKKKSSILFQSSFLKQHNDEEAVFKSFRDINELIKDMLQIKGRYGAVETELKEMHERYSQLSLQFAEVEGERQKLMMTLKSIRQSRKAQNLIRSTSTSPGDHS